MIADMVEAARLLLLVLALGAGLAAMTFCGMQFQARRSSLFRALLASIALFNLLILGGLVFWYARIHLETAGAATVAVLLCVLAILKVAWLVAFVALVRWLVSEARALRGVVLAGAAVLVVHWGLLGVGGLEAGLGFVELAVVLGALGATGWLLRQSGRTLGRRRRSLRWFAGYHAVIFTAMLVGVVRGWVGPGAGEAVPVANSLWMIAYNLFPLVWVRSFHAHEKPGAADDLDRYGITPREREIIGLIAAGRTNQEIADQLFISLATVKDHNYNIFRKTGVRNRVELLNLFRRGGGS